MQKLLTPRDLAERFGNDVNYWAKLRCSGDGPEFIKLGRIYYEEAAVEKWLAERRRKSTSDAGPQLGAE